ncbi:hypothetical protein FRC03_005544 [Tulasnella sp. 419]|nr:hypothetical protein FRC03_005544 [Tulasnella sp. 419]
MVLPNLIFYLLLSWSWVGLAGAEVIRVDSQDERILLDQYFLVDKDEPGCNNLEFSMVVNSTALFNFTGTAVSVIGSKSRRGGVFDVYLDSKLESTVDRYTASSRLECGMIMFEKTNLTFSQHSLQMTFRRNSTQFDPAISSPGYMDLQEIQYTIPDSMTAPTITPTMFSTQPAIATSTTPSNSAHAAKEWISTGTILGVVTGVLMFDLMAY